MADIVERSGCQLSESGLSLNSDISFSDWASIGKYLGALNRGVQWAIGDWLLFGEGREDWGEAFSQAMDATGLEYGTLSGYRWVARQIPPERRRLGLSYSHHVEVAPLTSDQQDHYLSIAEESQASTRELKARLVEDGMRKSREAITKISDPPKVITIESVQQAYLLLSPEGRLAFREWLGGQP